MQAGIEVTVGLILATIIGGIIGVEREKIHRPAGLRTHMLVCLSATLLTHASLFQFAASDRIIAGIVTGMGFLGAGTIFRIEDHVHGLTTAASLWTTAALGIAIGMGMYLETFVAVALVMLILNLNMIEAHKFQKKSKKSRKSKK